MRKIAICTALLACLSSTTASADDFDALLGELTFGGLSEPTGQTLTLDHIAADNLAPAPMTTVSAQAPVEAPVGEILPVPEPDALSDPGNVSEHVGAPLEAQPEPTVAAFCDTGACSSGSGRCGQRQCGSHLGHDFNCVPHTPPNLPTSSFYEYFKSNACNCRVWDGWQNRCIGASKHSRGECDCFAPRQKKSCFNGVSLRLPRGVCPAGNGSCQTGACQARGCHELPASWQQGDCAGEATCAAGPACDSPGCDG